MNLDAIAIGCPRPRSEPIIRAIGGGDRTRGQAAGALVVDRFLLTPMRYPGNYGFVPHTLSDDGDPIDVLVANTRPIIPGAIMNVRPIGVLRMEDDAGGDEKIIAVPSSRITQRYVNVKTHTDLPEITRHQIEHFFIHYKDLEPGKWVKLLGWGDVDEAHRLIAGRSRAYSANSRGLPTAAHFKNTSRVSSSIGKKLSMRSSWVVTSCGVPRVAMVVNSRSLVPPFSNSIGSTGPSTAGGVGSDMAARTSG